MRMRSINFICSFAIAALVAACGPASQRPGGGGGGGGPDGSSQCTPTGPESDPTTCADGIDNDCNGQLDCADPSCSGIGSCPVCGTVEHPEGMALPLPDGVGSSACTMDPDPACGADAHCYTIPDNEDGNPKECRQAYTSKLHFMGFAPGQTITDVSNIKSVCLTIEHSWMRDLEIDLRAPSGQLVQLQKMAGQDGSEVYLGMANDCDDDANPVPGTGAQYCWTPTATNPPTIDFANTGTLDTVPTCDGLTADELPPGDYQASSGFTPLVGATLDGDWQIEVADLWPIDNGYIFQWSISFDPSIVQTCDPPIQ